MYFRNNHLKIYFQINTIKCQDCNNETYNYDYTSILSLEPKNTLLESFEDYCSFKLTDENYKCMACGANKPAYKLCKIYKHSPIIFIHLKRFKFNGRGYVKDNTNVEIPNNINIENYCDTDINEVKSILQIVRIQLIMNGIILMTVMCINIVIMILINQMLIF